MFYLTTHSTHFIYGYMVSYIWLRTILIVRKETRCRHIGYSYRLTARVLLYAQSHRQDNTYHGLCYASRGALAGTRNSSMGSKCIFYLKLELKSCYYGASAWFLLVLCIKYVVSSLCSLNLVTVNYCVQNLLLHKIITHVLVIFSQLLE